MMWFMLMISSFGVWVGAMQAMEQQVAGGHLRKITTSDSEGVMVAREQVNLFGTIKRCFIDTEDENDDAGEHDPLVLPEVSSGVLKKLKLDISWIQSVHRDADLHTIANMDEQERTQSARIAVQNVKASKYHEKKMERSLRYLKWADFLDMPEAVQKYAKIVALLCVSKASIVALYQNADQHPIIRKDGINQLLNQEVYSYLNATPIWAESLVVPHGQWVKSSACSPDGNKIATVSWDNTVRVLNAITGALEREMREDSVCVYSIAFSRDGRKVKMALYDNAIVRVMDIATGKVMNNDQSEDWFYGEGFSQDGSRKINSINRAAQLTVWLNNSFDRVLMIKLLLNACRKYKWPLKQSVWVDKVLDTYCGPKRPLLKGRFLKLKNTLLLVRAIIIIMSAN